MVNKLRKISKEYYLRQVVSCWLVCYMFFMMPMQVAIADPNPAPDALPYGVIDRTGIDAPVYSPGRLDMTQTASEAIINWENFDIGQAATVEFFQPSSTATVLIRVHDGDVTGIMGTLTANGSVFIINPAGNVFGPGAIVDDSQFVASSLSIIDDNDFLDGLPYQFTGGALAGDVTNMGEIEAETIALIGGNVDNRGYLVADEYVVMAAGDSVVIADDHPVAVEVSMGIGSPGDFIINNDEDSEGIEAENIILAAGVINLTGSIDAYAGAASDAVAMVNIEAAGDITIAAEVRAEAVGNGVDDSIASVTIDAGGDVEVIADGDYAEIEAIAVEGSTNTANVAIDAGGDSKVIATEGGGADIYAEAWEGNDNTANVAIDAGGDSKVIATEDGYVFIDAIAEDGENNTGEVAIAADGNVEVIATEGGYANIDADAWDGEENNTAELTIDADGDVKVTAEDEGEAYIAADAAYGEENNTTEVTIAADGNVEVIATEGSYAHIGADAWQGFENNIANITIDADDDVKVTAEDDSFAGIYAVAGEGENNTGEVAIAADGNVEVIATEGGHAGIDADAWEGNDNTANTMIDADDDVKVIAEDDGFADIRADAGDGEENNTAEVTIDADGSIEVTAYDRGSRSAIYANSSDGENNTTNIIIGADDNLKVIAIEGSGAEIKAKARYGYNNTTDIEISAENVTAGAGGQGSEADILAHAYYGFENNAGVTICAPGEVTVANQGGESARIRSWAMEGELLGATTQAYAGEVKVSEDAYISAWAGEDQKDATDFCLTEDGEVVLDDGDAKLIIKEIFALDCSGAYASIGEIWPPNHKWEDVEILGVVDSNGNPVAITITGITQDEPVVGQGSGNTCPDGNGIGTSIARVRAERSGQGNGRVYEISFEAHASAGDICGGGVCNGTVQVCVPHDKGKGGGCIDDGQIYDSTASELLSADLNGDCSIDNLDLVILTENWLEDEPSADIAPAGGDNIVNSLDFAALARHWLTYCELDY